MLKKLLIIIGIIIIIIVAVFMYLLYGKDEVLSEAVQGIDLSSIPDDTYIGEYDGYRWSNTIEVVIEDGKIIEINILDDQMIPNVTIREELFNAIIEKQSIDVDTISEATISSKAYLEAIEDALNNAQ